MVYPVLLDEESDKTLIEMLAGPSPKPELGKSGQRLASTQKEFIKVVGEILQSSHARSVIQSLVARSNDVKSAAVPA